MDGIPKNGCGLLSILDDTVPIFAKRSSTLVSHYTFSR